MFDNVLEIAIWAGSALLTLLLIGLFLAKLYRRASKEVAFVRTGVGGESVVMNGGALVLPVFHETMPVNMNTVRLAVDARQHPTGAVDHVVDDVARRPPLAGRLGVPPLGRDLPEQRREAPGERAVAVGGFAHGHQ